MVYIRNFPPNSISVHFPLLYLHGDIENISSKYVTCHNKTLSSEIQWPVVKNEFKLFTFLKHGRNDIVIFSDDEEFSLTVTYIKQEQTRYILPVYIICAESDGTFLSPNNVNNSVEEAVKKIQLNTRLMQTFIAESLWENGFERNTFYLPEDKAGQPTVKIFNSKLKLEDTKSMNPSDLYSYFSKEINSSFPEDPCCKYLCFMSCTRYFPPSDETFDKKYIMSYVRGHAALGGGNMALFGTGSFHTWASNLEELYSKFTDTSLIDRSKEFDDSCGRGMFWANYSTTLGATIHELGHCFDLPHTPHGIMCRGHDDMNCFYTVVEPFSDRNRPVLAKNSSLDDTGKYKGAHWHRASAVVLRYHKWLNPTHSVPTQLCKPSMSLHPNLLGPVGNSGPCCQSNQKAFNSKKWLDGQDLTLSGIVFYHGEYLYGVQFLGVKKYIQDGEWHCKGSEVASAVYGSAPPLAVKTVLRLDHPAEKITSIKIRSGAWIDGIQVMTNLKSSTWLGGTGGDQCLFTFSCDRNIDSWCGTAGEFVGSLAFSVNEDVHCSVEQSAITFNSTTGIRLFRVCDDIGEVSYFEEYTDDPPPRTISIDLKKIFREKTKKIDGAVFDDDGEKLEFSLSPLDLDLLSQL